MNALPVPTLESVAVEFELWRKIKISKFSKIPPHLANLVRQLQRHYKKSHILKALKLNDSTFKKITATSQFTNQNNNIKFIELPSTQPVITEPKTSLANCLFQRQDGTQLTINTSSVQQLKEIIQLFLCCK
jgi:hypothetical protein